MKDKPVWPDRSGRAVDCILPRGVTPIDMEERPEKVGRSATEEQSEWPNGAETKAPDRTTLDNDKHGDGQTSDGLMAEA